MTDKKYPELTDLGIGVYNLKVWPAKEYSKEKGAYIEGSHKHGEGKGGFAWWMYQTKIDDKYVNLFGNAKNKEFLDSGKVQVRIKAKEIDGEEMFTKDGKPVLISFINEYKGGVIHGEGSNNALPEPESEADIEVPF